MISEVMRRGARIYAPTDEWNHAARCVTEMASRPVQILELAARQEKRANEVLRGIFVHFSYRYICQHLVNICTIKGWLSRI